MRDGGPAPAGAGPPAEAERRVGPLGLPAADALLDLVAQIAHTPYEQYGAPKLKVICERLGFPMPDDMAALRMARGEPCTPGCAEGCAR